MFYKFVSLADNAITNSTNSFSIFASTDFITILMPLFLGRLWVSKNSGTSWNERRPWGYDGDLRWSGNCDSTGKYMVVHDNIRFYLSEDYGDTWSEIKPFGDSDISGSVYISGDGSSILAAEYGGRIQFSANRGTSWTEVQPDGNRDGDWGSLRLNTDGTKLLTIESGGTTPYIKIYRSVNSGVVWSDISPKALVYPFLWCPYIWVSNDLNSILVSVYKVGDHNHTDLNINKTINGGAAWTTITPPHTEFKENLLISASQDMTILFINDMYYNPTYYSLDSGTTWNTFDLTTEHDNATCLFSNSDGKKCLLFNSTDSILYLVREAILTITKSPTGTLKTRQNCKFTAALT